MAQAEDSPLSITANIAGILTFLAAICTAVYIRYSTLRNSLVELESIHKSTTATIDEVRAIQGVPAHYPSLDDDGEGRRLYELVESLVDIEDEIKLLCYGAVSSTIGNHGPLVEKLISTVWNALHRVRLDNVAAAARQSISAVFNFGRTPIMIRWYRVREKVLELVQQRKNARSRLLFHQISAATAYVGVSRSALLVSTDGVVGLLRNRRLLSKT